MILCDASCSFNSPPPKPSYELCISSFRYSYFVTDMGSIPNQRDVIVDTQVSLPKRGILLLFYSKKILGEKKEEINRCIGPAAASRHEFFSSLSLSRGKKRERKKRRGKFWSSDSCSLSPSFFLEYNDIKRFQKGLLCASSAVPTL